MTKSHVLIDSSVWIAFTSEEDSLHQQALLLIKKLKEDHYVFVTSLFILSETLSKLRLKYGQQDAHLFFNEIKLQKRKKEVTIVPEAWSDVEDSIQLMNQHPTPNTFSLTDASCVILMKKHHIDTIATFDRDFKKLGVKVFP